MRVELLRVDNTQVTTLATHSNDSAEAWLWNSAIMDLSAYAGQTLQLRFYAKNDAKLPTSFFVDDVSIEACTGGTTTSTPTVLPSGTPTGANTPGPSATPRARLFLPLIMR
jgi:hypothetical protein